MAWDVSKDVSRETQQRLEGYVELLEKWNPTINLVSRSTIPDIWRRHIADSAQIFDLRPAAARNWLDLGSGGGLPGIVIAILAMETQPKLKVSLVESDLRKATFLRTVIRTLMLNATVHQTRVETLEPQGADVISARALAPLDELLGYCERHLCEDGVALFPKGAQWQKEVDNARRTWRFTLEACKSITESRAAILKVGDISRV